MRPHLLRKLRDEGKESGAYYLETINMKFVDHEYDLTFSNQRLQHFQNNDFSQNPMKFQKITLHFRSTNFNFFNSNGRFRINNHKTARLLFSTQSDDILKKLETIIFPP